MYNQQHRMWGERVDLVLTVVLLMTLTFDFGFASSLASELQTKQASIEGKL